MNKHRLAYLAIITLSIVGASFILKPTAELMRNGEDTMTRQAPTMRGLCWVAGDSIADHNIRQVADIGANWISQTPFGWMNGHDSPEVVLSPQRGSWGGNDNGIAHTAEHAQEAGIKTMLKPHIWLRRSGDKWRSDIAMNSNAEWDAWFQSYADFIVHYAKLAEANNIASLCIGTELHQTIKKTDRWRTIIKEIRKVYNGDLTYAANWYQEYEDVKFWDDLDYIGIQGYFPISNKEYPEKKELLKSWKKHKKNLSSIAKQYDKKIVFTEIGYKNTSDAAITPWTWPQDLDHQEITISEETQQVCYEALFESFWHEPWFDGIFIWKWFHSTHAHKNFDTYFARNDERRKERAKRRGREYNSSVRFSPQRTSAITTLSYWYTGANKKT